MITDSFDEKSKPMISLKDVYGEQKHLTDICIITFSGLICKAILESHECEQIAEIGACNGNIPIYSFHDKGRVIAFYLSPIGSTIASQCLLEVNWLIGATKFVMFGSSGSLAYEKTANRFVIPTEAYRDEGMSYHYAPAGDYITVKNSSVVRAVFDEINVPYVEGKTWTTDAILRETSALTAKRRAEGCIAVEMEIAGVQAVCDFHGLNLYTFIVTGDVLSDDSYCLGSISDANHNIDKFQLALEIASRI
ncbi:MAG: nucleoside phosphorylase [Clostridia bacterium]|nr:nucleoside phosphorylase [Clostridia bacterium]